MDAQKEHDTMLTALRGSIRYCGPLVALALLLATTPHATAVAAAAPKNESPAASIPVVGTVVGGGTFNGILNITSFAVQNGQVVALGTLSGVATTAAGAATSVLTVVSIPVTVAQATCAILHLDLGPLSLNVLGLQVNLSRIVLDITAQTGAGNLLGNLLCSVAGLLDNPSGLANVLNNLLGALLG
jgi:hypothetical protein